jgi:hypothetical protein
MFKNLVLIALLGFATPVMAQQPARPTAPANATPQIPPPEAMIILIRSTVVALSHANLTNNYSVLSSLGSPSFQKANPAARLQTVFTAFRTNNIDMNPVVFVTPQLTSQPVIENGRLRLVGFFPSQPMRVNFDLQFEPSGGVWKLFGVAVNLAAQTAALAPATR